MNTPRIALLAIFCFYGFFMGHSQTKTAKQHVYWDEDNNEISKIKFKLKIDYSYNVDVTIPTDSIIYHKLYVRNRFGKIESPAHLSSLRSQIQKSLGIEIDFSKDVGFGYFPELNTCTREYDGHAFYLVEPRFNEYKIPYFAVIDPEAGDKDYPFPFSVDTNHVFRDFFPEAVLCELWIVFRPDGSFRTFIGEGGPAIFDHLKKEWTPKYIKKAMHSKDVFPNQ